MSTPTFGTPAFVLEPSESLATLDYYKKACISILNIMYYYVIYLGYSIEFVILILRTIIHNVITGAFLDLRPKLFCLICSFFIGVVIIVYVIKIVLHVEIIVLVS